MTRACFTAALAGAALLGLGSGAARRRGGRVRQLLRHGSRQGRQEDHRLLDQREVDGKTYCFGNAAAKDEFMKDVARVSRSGRQHRQGAGDLFGAKK